MIDQVWCYANHFPKEVDRGGGVGEGGGGGGRQTLWVLVLQHKYKEDYNSFGAWNAFWLLCFQ